MKSSRSAEQKLAPRPLSETNPYLRDPKVRAKMVTEFVRSSSAIEGIVVPARKRVKRK